MKLRRILSFVLLLFLIGETLPQVAPAAKAEMPYTITVDLTNQIVTIYSTDDETIVRQMLCSTGLNDCTPTGTFTLCANKRKDDRKEWYFFRSYNCYAKYATRIFEGYMFHSIPYNRKRESSMSKKGIQEFGQPASHGCIRLRPEDAKFIATNCLEGTTVKIYKSTDQEEDLRALLFESSYTGKNGMSYNSYLGIPDEPGLLGRFSAGSEVENLQYRLRALGFFDDAVSGEYRTSTINAIKQFQRALGLEENGYVTEELKALIFAQDAPTARNVTLTEGMSGPAVRNLQTDLTSLQLYDGELDGVYDGDVIRSVQKFQDVYGYTADGEATAEIQKAIHYETDRIAAHFGDTPYICEYATESIPMVIVSTSARVRLRSEPSTESKALDSVSDGTTLYLLEKGERWSKVQGSSGAGYMKNGFLKPSSRTLAHLRYVSENGDMEIAVGSTLADYEAGAALPCVAFADYLANEGTSDDYEDAGQYATVNTRAEGLKLNLRAAPSTEGEVLAALENGAQLEVLLKTAVWSLVRYDGIDGYLMNEYLDFWTGPKGSLGEEIEEEDVEEETYDETLYARVLIDAKVFDLDSEDANCLGSLKKGTQVILVQSDDDWSLIELDGRQGYMRNADLQFILDTTTL